MSSLYDPRVRRVLDDMHASADRNDPPLLEKARGKRGTERTSLLDDAFIPVSADAGRLLYVLARGAARSSSSARRSAFRRSISRRPCAIAVQAA